MLPNVFDSTVVIDFENLYPPKDYRRSMKIINL